MNLLKIIVFLTLITSCDQEVKKEVVHALSYVGHISFDSKLDDPQFKPCNEDLALVYYNFGKPFQIEGEKPTIIKAFKDISISDKTKQTGYITVRFMVNCEGETGRFRVEQIDMNYKEMTFSKELTDQILRASKGLVGWYPPKLEGRSYDYYKYITLKIIDNQIIEILP